MGDLDGHAWSTIELDGDWYDVDVTWDDNKEVMDEAISGIVDDASRGYYQEALADEAYAYALRHYLCNLKTSDLTKHTPADWHDLQYYTKDGQYILCLVSDSVHYRANNKRVSESWPHISGLMDLLPKAKGTRYRVVN